MDNTERELLRFTTAGSVDDGKSTLIGRLLYDSKSIFQDQLNAVEKSSNKKGLDHLDLSLLTDGLKDEKPEGKTLISSPTLMVPLATLPAYPLKS